MSLSSILVLYTSWVLIVLLNLIENIPMERTKPHVELKLEGRTIRVIPLTVHTAQPGRQMALGANAYKFTNPQPKLAFVTVLF